MIRSEVGVTARPALDGESACAPEPRRRGFATSLRRVLADGCGLRFVGILWPIRPTQLGFGPNNIKPKQSFDAALETRSPVKLAADLCHPKSSSFHTTTSPTR